MVDSGLISAFNLSTSNHRLQDGFGGVYASVCWSRWRMNLEVSCLVERSAPGRFGQPSQPGDEACSDKVLKVDITDPLYTFQM